MSRIALAGTHLDEQDPHWWHTTVGPLSATYSQTNQWDEREGCDFVALNALEHVGEDELLRDDQRHLYKVSVYACAP